MPRTRRARERRRAFSGVVLAVALACALPAGGFEGQAGAAPRGKMAPGTAGMEGRQSFSLCLLDLPPTQNEEFHGVGARWSRGGLFSHYAGFGATLADVFGSADPLSADDESDDALPSLGGWIGAGAAWCTSDAFHLNLSTRWTPRLLTLPKTDLVPGDFQALATLSVRW